MSEYIAESRANPDSTTLVKPDDLSCTVSMTIVLLMALFKTFFFLRISDTLAYLVTLIVNCIVDLKIFLLFYVILIYMFALIVGVLGWQVDTGIEIDTMEGILTETVEGAVYSDTVGVLTPEEAELDAGTDAEATGLRLLRGRGGGGSSGGGEEDGEGEVYEYPGAEYAFLGKFAGNLLSVLRMSMGDNDFSAVALFDEERAIVFWVVWALIAYLTSIIFFNFVVAEASASYERVCDNLDEVLILEKAQLINESEEMTGKYGDQKKKFPRYLIVRDTET